jgi:hypothetical protein
LDVYIEELNTGIEYHGQQHYQPIEFFGGSQAFLANQRRDRSKMQKCKMNSTHLIIVREGYDIKYVINEIESLEENLYRRKS